MADSTVDAKTLKAERDKNYTDYWNNIIPKRIPVAFTVPFHIMAQYGNIDMYEFQFDYTLLEKVAYEICDIIYSDVCPIGGIGVSTRTPSYYQLVESQAFVMGANGFVQHPEVVGMHDDEYDALIADAYATILETVLPRQHKALSMDDPVKRGNAIHQAITAKADEAASLMPILGGLAEKHGYQSGPPRGSAGFTAAPYDFLADQLRSFSEISKDIRRNREKVAAACEALYPLMFKMGLPPSPSPLGAVSTPLHMPTYMREKDFVEVWLPTYKRLLEEYAARGIRVSAFNEHDWMRYLDILQDLPAATVLRFEYGDPQTIKDKLGDKFHLGGLYPITLIKTGTKQQCIDKAKEILDIMLPGGGYVFGFDKGPIMASDIPFENYNAVAETVRDYGVYDNPGASFGRKLNEENFPVKPIPELKSRYAFSWEDHKAQYPYTPDSYQSRIEGYHNQMFAFYMNLLT